MHLLARAPGMFPHIIQHRYQDAIRATHRAFQNLLVDVLRQDEEARVIVGIFLGRRSIPDRSPAAHIAGAPPSIITLANDGARGHLGSKRVVFPEIAVFVPGKPDHRQIKNGEENEEDRMRERIEVGLICDK